ncbi:uncharacterized protein [Anabrus simplex]|uniref:uncharacterized protein n=1 Tax=Anabrus simplex TaxID=316456 RepID=UPI0035A316CF
MDLELKVKEETAWLEGTTTASLESMEHLSEVIALKEEVKSELTEPGSMQENPLQPSEDTKEEIFIEEQTDDQLLPYIKEETKHNNYKRFVGAVMMAAVKGLPGGHKKNTSLVGMLGLMRSITNICRLVMKT